MTVFRNPGQDAAFTRWFHAVFTPEKLANVQHTFTTNSGYVEARTAPSMYQKTFPSISLHFIENIANERKLEIIAAFKEANLTGKTVKWSRKNSYFNLKVLFHPNGSVEFCPSKSFCRPIGSGASKAAYAGYVLSPSTQFQTCVTHQFVSLNDTGKVMQYKAELAMINILNQCAHLPKTTYSQLDEKNNYLKVILSQKRALGESTLLIDSRYSVQDKLNFLIGMVEGLKEMHDLGIAHRDIKPANALVYDDNTGALMDFGFSELSKDVTALCGTPFYMSPECLQGFECPQQAGLKGVPVQSALNSDTYSLAITFITILVNSADYPPFFRRDIGPEHILGMKLQMAGQMPLDNYVTETWGQYLSKFTHIPRELKTLLLQMLDHNPLNRPRASLVLQTLEHIMNKPAMPAPVRNEDAAAALPLNTNRAFIPASLSDMNIGPHAKEVVNTFNTWISNKYTSGMTSEEQTAFDTAAYWLKTALAQNALNAKAEAGKFHIMTWQRMNPDLTTHSNPFKAIVWALLMQDYLMTRPNYRDSTTPRNLDLLAQEIYKQLNPQFPFEHIPVFLQAAIHEMYRTLPHGTSPNIAITKTLLRICDILKEVKAYDVEIQIANALIPPVNQAPVQPTALPPQVVAAPAVARVVQPPVVAARPVVVAPPVVAAQPVVAAPPAPLTFIQSIAQWFSNLFTWFKNLFS